MADRTLKQNIQAINEIVRGLKSASADLGKKQKDFILVMKAIQDGILNSNDQIETALEGVASGKFDNVSGLQQLAKVLQLNKDESKELITQWRDMKVMTVDQVKRSKEYRDIIVDLSGESKEIVDFMDKMDASSEGMRKTDIERLDLSDKLLKNYQEFQKTVELNKKQLSGINIDLSAGVSTFDQLVDLGNQLTDLFDPSPISFDDLDLQQIDIQKLTDGFRNGLSDVELSIGKFEVHEALDQIENVSNDHRKAIEEEFKLRQIKMEQYIAYSMGLQRDLTTGIITDIKTEQQLSRGAHKEAVNQLRSKAKHLLELSSEMANINSLNADEITILNEKVRQLSEIDGLMVAQLATSNRLLKAYDDDLQKSIEFTQSVKKAADTSENLQDIITGIGDTFDDVFSVLPIGIQRMFGLQKVSAKFSDTFTDALGSANEHLAVGGSRAEAISMFTNNFSKNIVGAVGPLGLVAAGIGLVVAAVTGLESKITDISTELGVSRAVAKQLHEQSLELYGSFSNQLLTQEQILDVQKAHVEKYGQVLDLSKDANKELVEFAGLTATAYGMATGEAYQLAQLMKEIGADDALAKNMVATTAAAAEAAGIAPSIITKDLLEASEEVSLFFAGAPRMAARAAIEVRRMGMSLKQAGGIADKMLNIDGFMTDMHELAAMTSGQLNLSRAFDLRMQGDISGSIEEILAQYSKMDDSLKQNEFVQRKFAAATGMTVDQLNKSIKVKEMSMGMDEEQRKILLDNLDTLSAGDLVNRKALQAKAKDLNATQRMQVAFGKIVATLQRAFLPAIEAFSDTLDASMPLLDVIGVGFRLIGLAIKAATPILKGFLMPFQLIGNFVEVILSGFQDWSSISTTLTSQFGNWESPLAIASNLVKMIGVYMGGKYLLGKIGLVQKSLLSFPNLIKKIPSMGGSLFGGILGKGKDVAGSVVGEAAESVSKGMGSISEKVSGGMKQVSGSMKSGFGMIKDFVVGIGQTISQFLTSIESGVGNLFKSVLGGIGEGLSKFGPKALIGAAALGVLSGALWVTSKAMQEFNSVEWSSVAKAGVVIAGLAGVGMLLGGTAPQMIIGAAAIAVLGASLIPTAYALKMFNDVDWGSLGKAGAALIGLGAVGAIMGTAAPLLLAGAVSMAAVGAALIPMGYGLKMFAEAANTAVPFINTIFDGLIGLGSIPVGNLLGIGPALLGIGAGLGALAAGGALSGISSFLNGDPLKKLERFANLANPMDTLSTAVGRLAENLSKLFSVSGNMPDLDFGEAKFETASNQINKSITTTSDIISNSSEMSAPVNASVIPNNVVDQNIISPPASTTQVASTTTPPRSNPNKRLEQLMEKMLVMLEAQANRPAVAVIGHDQYDRLNEILKGRNNY